MHRHTASARSIRSLPALALTTMLAGQATAQSIDPAVFVANNGNLEGSVTSFIINPDGTLEFVQKLITGERGSTIEDEPGCNPANISISPSGRYLATSHASGSAVEQITIYEIDANAQLTILSENSAPADVGLGLTWINESYLAVTDSFAARVIVYRFNPGTGGLLPVSDEPTGSFSTSVVAHPNGEWIYVQDSFGDAIRAFNVDEDGQLSLIDTVITSPVFPIGLEISPNGRFIYAGGGISGGGDKFVGYRIADADGSLSPIPGSPFTSPGASPKGFAVSADNNFLFVEHGTDATIRVFSLDPESGVPTNTGESFDVGTQGTLGGTAATPGTLFVTDESTAIDGVRGLYALSIDSATGAITPNPGTPVDTQGITPETIAVWTPPAADCAADYNDDGIADFFDVQAFLNDFQLNNPAADFNNDGLFDFFDVQAFLNAFQIGCP